MIQAKNEQKHLVVSLLTAAFRDNQSVNYIVRQDSQKMERIAALMDYSFEICRLFGGVYLSPDRNACALILFPHQRKFSIAAIWLDIKLIFRAIGIRGLFKTLQRESAIKKKQPKLPMAYLWFIGVEPRFQHQGIGTDLLNQVIDFAYFRDLPVFLETSTMANLPWYERAGFAIYDKLSLGYTMHFLKRPLDTR